MRPVVRLNAALGGEGRAFPLGPALGAGSDTDFSLCAAKNEQRRVSPCARRFLKMTTDLRGPRSAGWSYNAGL